MGQTGCGKSGQQGYKRITDRKKADEYIKPAIDSFYCRLYILQE